jgi:hypothetical protein
MIGLTVDAGDHFKKRAAIPLAPCIFPEMKLHNLVPNFYIYVSGSDLYIPMINLICILYFLVYMRKRTLSSTGAEKKAGNCRQTEVGGSSLPSPLLLRLSQELT